MYDWSDRLLGDAERLLLRWLGVFRDGFSIEAVRAVVGERAGRRRPARYDRGPRVEIAADPRDRARRAALPVADDHARVCAAAARRARRRRARAHAGYFLALFRQAAHGGGARAAITAAPRSSRRCGVNSATCAPRSTGILGERRCGARRRARGRRGALPVRPVARRRMPRTGARGARCDARRRHHGRGRRCARALARRLCGGARAYGRIDAGGARRVVGSARARLRCGRGGAAGARRLTADGRCACRASERFSAAQGHGHAARVDCVRKARPFRHACVAIPCARRDIATPSATRASRRPRCHLRHLRRRVPAQPDEPPHETSRIRPFPPRGRPRPAVPARHRQRAAARGSRLAQSAPLRRKPPPSRIRSISAARCRSCLRSSRKSCARSS